MNTGFNIRRSRPIINIDNCNNSSTSNNPQHRQINFQNQTLILWHTPNGRIKIPAGKKRIHHHVALFVMKHNDVAQNSSLNLKLLLWDCGLL